PPSSPTRRSSDLLEPAAIVAEEVAEHAALGVERVLEKREIAHDQRVEGGWVLDVPPQLQRDDQRARVVVRAVAVLAARHEVLRVLEDADVVREALEVRERDRGQRLAPVALRSRREHGLRPRSPLAADSVEELDVADPDIGPRVSAREHIGALSRRVAFALVGAEAVPGTRK